jgi:hypothetical protein
MKPRILQFPLAQFSGAGQIPRNSHYDWTQNGEQLSTTPLFR